MSPSRLLWFALGGVSAFWWIRKHDEEKAGLLGAHFDERRRWHCMKHSWGRRNELPSSNPDSQEASNQMDKDIEVWKTEAKERLSKALETGFEGVVGVIANFESAYNESAKRASEARAAAQHESENAPREPFFSSNQTVPSEASAPPAVHSPNIMRAEPYPQPPQQFPAAGASDPQILSQVLAAIEKLNNKLDNIQSTPKPTSDSFPPRWV